MTASTKAPIRTPGLPMILSVHDSVFPVVRPNNRIIQLFPALQGVIKSGVYASLPLLLNTSIYGGVSGAERECNRFQRFPSHPLSIIPLFSEHLSFWRGQSRGARGGNSSDQRALRQKVSKHISASSPWVVQNWPD